MSDQNTYQQRFDGKFNRSLATKADSETKNNQQRFTGNLNRSFEVGRNQESGHNNNTRGEGSSSLMVHPLSNNRRESSRSLASDAEPIEEKIHDTVYHDMGTLNSAAPVDIIPNQRPPGGKELKSSKLKEQSTKRLLEDNPEHMTQEYELREWAEDYDNRAQSERELQNRLAIDDPKAILVDAKIKRDNASRKEKRAADEKAAEADTRTMPPPPRPVQDNDTGNGNGKGKGKGRAK
ncbi:hypothetical protein GLAREA_06831 [Glarea lozoyensis ATCC 20868]|uniref:Uncharacterized protein n=1 Tax=Glarea lozoyensis (strain ATCC 20868 / MF5171) TaxID=1116229 RepID=S3E642_GLAL2|nr:uncharacterized protein GLAREA_06831 [Glarea lozoyensis ATCC 20868]EPE33818.1 hypothetical protein GLAREA_06831 [Glarea lozoyensis ATCC 20868]